MQTRSLALEAASKLQMGIGEWVARAIERQAEIDQRTEILPPGDNLPAIYEPPPSPIEITPYIELLRALTDAGQDASGLARELVRAARAQLKGGKRG